MIKIINLLVIMMLVSVPLQWKIEAKGEQECERIKFDCKYKRMAIGYAWVCEKVCKEWYEW